MAGSLGAPACTASVPNQKYFYHRLLDTAAQLTFQTTPDARKPPLVVQLAAQLVAEATKQACCDRTSNFWRRRAK